MISARRALLSAIAAVLAVTATSHAAISMAAGRNKLSAELPAGVTLAKASVDQTAGALRSAVSKDTANATDLLRAAIMAKEPKQGQGKLSCSDVDKLTRSAIASDSAAASQLVDTASALHPECADDLNKLTNASPNDGNTGGLYAPADDYGFGAGFGPGFPGAPGFVGSAPSGGFALPPASPTPMTSVTGL